MQLYSTNNPGQLFSLKEAVLKGLPDDNGLFMPNEIPVLPSDFFDGLTDLSFPELAYEASRNLFQNAIPDSDLLEIITRSVNFPAPLVQLDERTHVLELFHGPSLAFKDFGARFMAQLMGYFNRGADKDLVILVATSGDTGGAVAAGFHNTPGTKVVILYPSGRVSPLQEKQLTTLGGNITALEVDGSFDDCQALVKRAFLDGQLNRQIRLTSANSINIARLIPQTFYYFEAYKQLGKGAPAPVFVVPSGNFGNLTAGLLAWRMGLPVSHFVAATNRNAVVPQYLETCQFDPHPSFSTISNAMDVGNPSNFYRMIALFMEEKAPFSLNRSTWNNMKKILSGYSFDDAMTRSAILNGYKNYDGYIFDPHGAVGLLAWNAFEEENPNLIGIILETAHPSKFLDVVEEVLTENVPVPERLAVLADRQKVSVSIPAEFDLLKDFLMGRFGG